MPHMGNGSEYQGCEPQDLTDNGICTQCGECCTNLLPISDSDIRRIRHYIKRHGIRPINHIPVLIQGPTLDMVCPFLDDKKPDRKCLIYPVRLLDGLFFCMIQQYAQLEKNQLYKKSLINEQAVSFW